MVSMDFQSTLDSGSEVITALTSRLKSSEEEQEVLREELARAMAEIERLRSVHIFLFFSLVNNLKTVIVWQLKP